MAKRRTRNIQRRPRASEAAMSRRLGEGSGGLPIDWRILLIVGVLVVGLVAVVVALVVGSAPNPWTGTPQADAGRAHVAPGTPISDYTSVPATSGPHWDTPAAWGVYPDPAPEGQLVHNLEHGGIVIWYQPGQVDEADVDRMSDLVVSQVESGLGGRFKFILSPWAGEDFGHPIAVTAWRRLLYLDEANLDAIRGFADANYQNAPENAGGPAPGANPVQHGG